MQSVNSERPPGGRFLPVRGYGAWSRAGRRASGLKSRCGEAVAPLTRVLRAGRKRDSGRSQFRLFAEDEIEYFIFDSKKHVRRRWRIGRRGLVGPFIWVGGLVRGAQGEGEVPGEWGLGALG